MSYDVSIGNSWFNYTSNVAGLWYDHIPDTGLGGGLNEINGLTGKQAVEVLSEGFKRINESRHKHRCSSDHDIFGKYDAPNGWGSAYGAIIFMANIMAACAQNPRKKVHVCR